MSFQEIGTCGLFGCLCGFLSVPGLPTPKANSCHLCPSAQGPCAWSISAGLKGWRFESAFLSISPLLGLLEFSLYTPLSFC